MTQIKRNGASCAIVAWRSATTCRTPITAPPSVEAQLQVARVVVDGTITKVQGVHPLPARGKVQRAPRAGAGGLTTPTALITGITARTGRTWPKCCSTKATALSGSYAVAPPRIRTDRAPGRSGGPRVRRPARPTLPRGRDSRGGAQEIYNLAAQSFVQTSWTQPVLTGIHCPRRHPSARSDAQGRARGALLQASSSEMFGKVQQTPQNEQTPFYPRSPYAWPRSTATGSPSTTARASACTPCPHPLQPRVRAARSRVRHAQVTDGVARIHLGMTRELRLGISTRAAIGDSPATMWMHVRMLQPDTPRLRRGDWADLVGAPALRARVRGVGLDYREHVVQDRASCGPPRWTCSSRTPARRASGWGGHRR